MKFVPLKLIRFSCVEAVFPAFKPRCSALSFQNANIRICFHSETDFTSKFRVPVSILSQFLVPGVEFCQEWVVGLGHGCRLRVFAPVAFHIVLCGSESWVFVPVGFKECCPELRQGPALLRVLRKRNSSGKASSDAGPELAGRESCVAMESPQALMCPLEKGVRGIEISGLCRCSGSPS